MLTEWKIRDDMELSDTERQILNLEWMMQPQIRRAQFQGNLHTIHRKARIFTIVRRAHLYSSFIYNPQRYSSFVSFLFFYMQW